MIKFNLLLIISLILSLDSAYGQNYVTYKTADPKLKEKYKEALKYTQTGDYTKAAKLYSSIVEKEPRFIDAHLQLGSCLEEANSIAGAIDEYKIILKIDTLYEPRVLFRLALLLKKKEQYKEAAELLSSFVNINKGSKELLNKAKLEESNCRFMLSSKEENYHFKPENLGHSINSMNHEYLPCISVDGATLIFTRITKGQEDFWSSKWIDGQWSMATPLNDINSNENEGAETISADGQTMVFTGCDYPDTKGRCDLYISYFKKGFWTKPVNMGAPINTPAWESQPSLSADGTTLYFSSDRKGGLGKNDIWMSTLGEDGSWSIPIDLPTPINNEYNSESPFIHPDGKTLYFRCDGLPGYGGFDMFISRLDNNANWSAPINMGKGINTTGDEGALMIDFNGKYGYYASDGKQLPGIENYGRTDIYRFELPDQFKPLPVTYVKAKVKDMITGKQLNAEVQVQDLNAHKTFNKSKTDDDGTFLVCLPVGKSYALNVSKDKYTFYSEHFSLNEVKSKSDPYVLEIKLQKLDGTLNGKPGTPVVLRNIFFDSGSSTLREDSEYELQRLIDFLNTNPTTKIRINGHTDNVGKAEDNLKLSIDRAKAVYDYLVSKALATGRLTYKGFGETKPVTNNDTEEGRQMNRRIEFEVVGN